MSLQIDESTREAIWILTLKGDLTFGNAESIRAKILARAAEGHAKMVVDLTDVLFIDSTGLGALVGCHASLQKKKGALRLVNPNKRNQELIFATQLHTVLTVFSQVQDAVDSFFPERVTKPLDFSAFGKTEETSAHASHPPVARDESWFFPVGKSEAPHEGESKLELRKEVRAGWCIVKAIGRADGTTQGAFETALTEAAQGNEKVAVDLSALDYISSAGLRAVLQGARAAQARKGEFVLCRPTTGVNKVLEMSGIPHLIKIQDLPA